MGRIPKGKKSTDLPVRPAINIALLVNQKAVKAPGVIVPLTLLGPADEVTDQERIASPHETGCGTVRIKVEPRTSALCAKAFVRAGPTTWSIRRLSTALAVYTHEALGQFGGDL